MAELGQDALVELSVENLQKLRSFKVHVRAIDRAIKSVLKILP